MANRGGETKKKPKRVRPLDSGNDAALAFDVELKTYRMHLPELLDSEGEFVLIRGEEVDGTFDTYEAALEAGYTKYGLEQFLVKQIRPVEPIQYFTRDLR
jgi:hypothetical protein